MRTAVSARSSRGSEPRLAPELFPPRRTSEFLEPRQTAGLPVSWRAPRFLALAFLVSLAFSCTTVEPPPPPPPEPAREQVVTWQIDPAEGYYANNGYVILEYHPPESLPDSTDRPRGGRLTVHLGYIDIRSANTLWYRFEVMEGSRRRVRLDGEDNIPNVKDPDQYWWNDLDVDLDEPVTGEISLIVTDKRISFPYRFTLRKVVTYR